MVHEPCMPGARGVDTLPRSQFLPILATAVTPGIFGIESDTLHVLQTLHHWDPFQLCVLEYRCLGFTGRGVFVCIPKERCKLFWGGLQGATFAELLCTHFVQRSLLLQLPSPLVDSITVATAWRGMCMLSIPKALTIIHWVPKLRERRGIPMYHGGL